VQVTKLPESISQAENAGSIPVTRSIEQAAAAQPSESLTSNAATASATVS
jgi:hypothetical protein